MAERMITFRIDEDIKVNLSKMTLDEVLKLVEEAASTELDKDVKISWNELKQQSAIFLSAIQALDENYINATTANLKRVVAKPEIASYVNSMQKKKEAYYVQNLYMLAARFEDFLSRFREEDKERKILYVFTNKDASVVESYEMTLKELILNADKHGRWADIAKKKLIDNGRTNVENNENGLFNEKHIQTAQNAYQGTFQRWSKYFEVHKSGQRQNGYVLWKEQRRWMAGNIVNTGDMKEAYAAFLFDEHQENDLCALNQGSAPYFSHDLIGNFYKQYVTKVTNLEAIIEEDVLTTDKQYGVKGRKASLPSLQQYVDVASIIVKQTNPLTKNDLEQEIDIHFKRGDELKGARNTYDTLNKVIGAEKVLNKEIKKIQSTFS